MRRLQGGAILSHSKRNAPYGPIDGEFLFLVSATLKLGRGRNARANTYCASAKVGPEETRFRGRGRGVAWRGVAWRGGEGGGGGGVVVVGVVVGRSGATPEIKVVLQNGAPPLWRFLPFSTPFFVAADAPEKVGI